MDRGTDDVYAVLGIAREAGKAILRIYQADTADWDVQRKGDDSPITVADLTAHQIISKGLAAHFPGMPILSEEGKNIPYEQRNQLDRYWCVDPLDGTKEFISRNGEFTVNIALIVKNKPVFGVIYVPVTDVMYYGIVGDGSYKMSGGETQRIQAGGNDMIAVGSKSHKAVEEECFLSSLPIRKVISVGSSLKFCYIAEGKAQVYYRHGPTMEWDTAAGHAIAVASGARMSCADGTDFTYNKPTLVNGSFVCYSMSLCHKIAALSSGV